MTEQIKNNFTILSRNLFYLSLISLIFLISVVFSTSKLFKKDHKLTQDLNDMTPKVLAAQNVDSYELMEYSRFPVLRKGAEFPLTSARSVMAIDLDSGISLYEKNPDLDSLPASTTKIMTAIVSMEYYDPAQEITIKRNGVVGQKMGLAVGETLTVDNLLKGLLIASANDAAEVLARNYEGGRDEFIEKMNEKVIKLRLSNTFFTNPTGLDNMGQTTTARDLMKLATYAMQKPYFAEIVGTKTLDIESVDGVYKHRLVSTNELLGKVKGVLGTKTGWTENARENLVTYVDRDSKRIIIVVLGSQDRFGETEELIEWIFGNYDWVDMET